MGFSTYGNSGAAFFSIYFVGRDRPTSQLFEPPVEPDRQEMKQLGFVDVVSYNTLLKGYLAANRMADARQLVQEMTKRGLSANKAKGRAGNQFRKSGRCWSLLEPTLNMFVDTLLVLKHGYGKNHQTSTIYVQICTNMYMT